MGAAAHSTLLLSITVVTQCSVLVRVHPHPRCLCLEEWATQGFDISKCIVCVPGALVCCVLCVIECPGAHPIIQPY